MLFLYENYLLASYRNNGAFAPRDTIRRKKPITRITFAPERKNRAKTTAKVILAIALLVALPSLPGFKQARAATAFGTEYRQLTETTGSINTGTTVSISTSGAANYIVDSYTTGSTLTGSPSSSSPSGYGWRTAGAFGQSVPAGTWSFVVETNTSGVTFETGEAFVKVYAYSTDALGGNVDPIGTATGSVDLLTLLGGTQTHNLSFSASAEDLAGRVLVVECWIIVTSPPLLAATVAFHTVSSVTSVTIPTSPSTTTYYLATPQLHSVGLAETMAAADSTARLYHASRAASSSLGFAEQINLHVTRSLPNELAVTERITTRTSRSLFDSASIADDPASDFVPAVSGAMAVTDSVAREYSAHRPLTDGIVTGDSIAIAVTRTMSEAITVSDVLSGKVTLRALLDSIAIADAPSTNFAPEISDAIATSDSVVKSVTRALPDSLAMADAVAARVASSRSMSETVAVASSAAATASASRSMADNIATTDVATTTASFARAIADSATMADSAARSPRSFRLIQEGLTTADQAVTGMGAFRPISDSVAVADSTPVHAGRQLGDILSISESIAQPPRLSDGLGVADALSVGLVRRLADALPIADQAVPDVADGPIPAGDTLHVSEQITSVSVHWSRIFAESLTLQECTPFVCNQSVHLSEGMSLAGAFIPPPAPRDQLAASDSIVGAAGLAKSNGDGIAVADRLGIAVRPAPLPATSALPAVGVLLVSGDGPAVEPLPASPAAGQYSMPAGEPNQLLSQLSPPVAVINSVPRPSLPGMTMVLSTYHVNLIPSPQVPGDDALVTIRVSEVPTGTRVAVPIDIGGMPPAAEHGNVPQIKLEYTPAVDSANFALVLSLVDSPPAGAQLPQAGLVPMYLDIRWVGTFAGPQDPGKAAFYSSPPVFTFAVAEAWAAQQNVQRDQNGVPLVSLNLLDEATGAWAQVNAVDRPAAAANGQYMFTAHLQHFSTYAVTANSIASGSSGGVRAPATVSLPPAAHLTVHLADSLLLSEAQDKAIRAQHGVATAVKLGEELRLGARPDSYSLLEIGDIDIHVKVLDIAPASAFPPTAKATVVAEIANSGHSLEEFVLSFSDGRDYRSSTFVRVGAGGSSSVTAEISFASSGIFGITARAQSGAGELLDLTTLTVTVPWLDVYLYFLIVLQAVLAAVIGTGVYLLVRFRRAWT